MIYKTDAELRAAFPAQYEREAQEQNAGLAQHGGIEFEG